MQIYHKDKFSYLSHRHKTIAKVSYVDSELNVSNQIFYFAN
jgi:hypothetical protein